MRGIAMHTLPTHTLAHRLDGCRIGWLASLSRRAESPQINQWADRGVVSPAGRFSELQRGLDNLEQLGRRIHPGSRSSRVEPAQIGIGFPGTHLPINQGEPLFNGGTHPFDRRIIADITNRPARPHQITGKRLNLRSRRTRAEDPHHHRGNRDMPDRTGPANSYSPESR